jgi:pyruvate, water dikinase
VDDLYWLDQVQPLDRKIVGEKAYYLNWLKQRGYSIPPGVVISAGVLQQGLAQVNWPGQLLTDLPNSFLYVDANQPRQLQMVAQQLRQVILALPVPVSLLQSLQEANQVWQTPAVIVRPSFSTDLEVAQFVKTTGLLTSHLCRPEPEALACSIQRVWAGLFSARSLFYWQRLRLQLRQIQLAVLVQPMQSVVAAGTVQIADQRVQIQATRGLGFGLMQTDIDTYGLNLASGWHAQQIAEKNYAYEIDTQAKTELTQSDWFSASIEGLQLTWVDPQQRHQPVLTFEQQQQLAQLAHQIQAELKTPVALEWTLNATEPHFRFTQLSTQLGGWVALTAGQLRTLDAGSPTLGKTQPIQSSGQMTGLKAAPGRAVARAWVVQHLPLDLTVVPPGVILVTPVLTPEQVIWVRQVAGVVTEQGGMTSHAAILARELGIPAVVGVTEATRRIQTNDPIALDGDQGEVYIGPRLAALSWVQANLPPQHNLTEPVAFAEPALPLQLWLTLSQPERLPYLTTLPVQGVGLIRSELMLLELFQQQHPQDWLNQMGQPTAIDQIAARIQRFAAAFAPRPVFYRSLDLQTSEWAASASTAHHSSMLSLRGTLRDLQTPDLFQVQLAALRRVQQQGYDNVMLLLPFVRTVEEFVFCRQQVEQAGLTQVDRFQLWIMAEVPSVLLLLPDYVAAGVQGITIGTNDLTQLLLGIDRNQAQLASVFNPYHPAVLRAVHQLAETAQQLKIPCAICNQGLDHQPELLYKLVNWGITAVSVEPSEVVAIQQMLQNRSLTH